MILKSDDLKGYLINASIVINNCIVDVYQKMIAFESFLGLSKK